MRTTVTALVAAGLAWNALATPPAPPALPHDVEWRIVVDDLHLDFTDTGRLRAFLSAVVEEALAQGERVGLRSTGPSQVTVAPTVDGPILRAAIRTITGNGLKAVDAVSARASTQGGHRAEIARRTRASLSALRQSVDEPAEASAVVIFVSNGLPLPPQGGAVAFDGAVTAARERTVRILAADARDPARLVPPPPDLAAALADLRATETESLRVLSSSTGGATARGLTDTLAAMAALRR